MKRLCEMKLNWNSEIWWNRMTQRQEALESSSVIISKNLEIFWVNSFSLSIYFEVIFLFSFLWEIWNIIHGTMSFGIFISAYCFVIQYWVVLDIGFWPPHDCKLIDLSSQDGHSQCPAQPFGIKVDFKVVKPTIANLLTLGNQLWWGSKLFATNLRRYLATLIELLQQQILTLYNLQ